MSVILQYFFCVQAASTFYCKFTVIFLTVYYLLCVRSFFTVLLHHIERRRFIDISFILTVNKSPFCLYNLSLICLPQRKNRNSSNLPNIAKQLSNFPQRLSSRRYYNRQCLKCADFKSVPPRKFKRRRI